MHEIINVDALSGPPQYVISFGPTYRSTHTALRQASDCRLGTTAPLNFFSFFFIVGADAQRFSLRPPWTGVTLAIATGPPKR